MSRNGSRERLEHVLYAAPEECRHTKWSSADGRAHVTRNPNGSYGVVPGDGRALASFDPDDVVRALIAAGTYPR